MQSTINVCLELLGNAFSVFFLNFLVCTGPGSDLDFFFICHFQFCIFCSNLFQFCCNFVTGFVGPFFSEIILDICELILSLPGIHVVMQCNDAITCVLASPSLLPFRGNQVQGSSILERKKIV